MSDDAFEPFDEWKCWRASTGMVAGFIGLVVSAAKLFGYVIDPEVQKSLIDLIVLLITIACFLGALYGRFFARTQIGTPEFKDKLRALFRKPEVK